MLRRFRIPAAVAVCFFGLRPSLRAQQTFTFDQLTQNNTAACSAPNYGLLGVAYCADAFPGSYYPFSAGWADDQYVYNSNNQPVGPAPIVTVQHDPSPAGTWNISKGRDKTGCCSVAALTDMHRMMYENGTGSTSTKVIVETQSWFCVGTNWWPGGGTPTSVADKLITQGCGTTWYDTWSEMNANFNPTSNPLNYMMVETWDGYEEGTEIETGIDNCLQASSLVPTVNQSSSQLIWTYQLTPNQDNLGSFETVGYYNVYYASGGCTQAANCSGFTLLASNITNSQANCAFSALKGYPFVNCTTGIMLDNYPFQGPGTYGIFVQAMGQPGIANWLSPVGAAYTVQ